MRAVGNAQHVAKVSPFRRGRSILRTRSGILSQRQRPRSVVLLPTINTSKRRKILVDLLALILSWSLSWFFPAMCPSYFQGKLEHVGPEYPMSLDKGTQQYSRDSTMNGDDCKIQAQKHSITQNFQISGVGASTDDTLP